MVIISEFGKDKEPVRSPIKASPNEKTGAKDSKGPVITPLESVEPPFTNIPEKHCQTHKQLFITVDTERCSPEYYVCIYTRSNMLPSIYIP